MSPPLLYAHAGHLVLDTIVYGGPVVLIAAAVLLFAKFEKRLVPAGQTPHAASTGDAAGTADADSAADGAAASGPVEDGE